VPNSFAPGSLFLNDVVIDNDGAAYLTDNLNSAILSSIPRAGVGSGSGSANGESEWNPGRRERRQLGDISEA